MKKSSKLIAYTAVFTALATLSNIFVVQVGGSNFISLVYVPCFFAGIFLGPVGGFTVGVLGDMLGGIIAPKGDYLPLIGLASGMLGLIPGLVFKYVKGGASDTVKLLISIALSLLICTAGLNTLALFLMYSKGKTFWAYLVLRLPMQLAVAEVNFILIGALLKIKPLTKMLDFKRAEKH